MSILPYADFLMLTTLLTRLGEILKQENVNSKNKKREMTNQSDEKEKVPESKNPTWRKRRRTRQRRRWRQQLWDFLYLVYKCCLYSTTAFNCLRHSRSFAMSISEPWLIGSSQKWDEDGGGVSGNKSWMGPAAGPWLSVQPRTANKRSSVYAAHSCACFSLPSFL